MKARSEARVGGTGQIISVELEDSDMFEVDGYDSMSLAQRWVKMTTKADLLVIKYLLDGQHVSQEWAAERVQQIMRAAQGGQ
jgi:hypothetical protein